MLPGITLDCDHLTLIRIAGGGPKVRDRSWSKDTYELISAFTYPELRYGRDLYLTVLANMALRLPTGFCAIGSGFDTRMIILCACSSNANLGSMRLSVRSLRLCSGILMGGPARHGPVKL